MSVLSIGGAKRKYWNCTKPDQPDFSLMITGDVVEIAAIPHFIFGTQTIDRFQDGNPKADVRLTLMCDDGEERSFTFRFSSSADSSKWCNMQRALLSAVANAGLSGKDLDELLGLNISVSTQQPPQGFNYGSGNPRPFAAQVNGRGTTPSRGMVDEVSKHRPGNTIQPGAEHMMTPEVAARPVNPAAVEAMHRAAAAMGVKLEPVDEPYYQQDIPF